MNALLPILAVTVPFFALVLAGYVAALAAPAAGIGDPRAQRLRPVLRAAVHAVSLRREHADRRGAEPGGAGGLPGLRAADGAGDDRRSRSTSVVRPEGRGVRRAGGGVSQHRLHGRAAAGRAVRPGDRRTDDRHHADRPVRHQLVVHRAGAGWAARPARRAHGGDARAARRAVQPAAVGDRARRRARCARLAPGGPGRCGHQDAGRRGHPGGAVHDRRGAVARRPACAHAHAAHSATCRWRSSSCCCTRCWCSRVALARTRRRRAADRPADHGR